ncbi:MAG TPA: cupin domain-containing protein [Pseudonocardiaceae bacterium]|nr:cupin domain-containing protein [Pseudonocardiaceae bacterium]
MTGQRVIHNPISGELITIRTRAEDTGGELLEWELVLAPGGRVPSSHAHPEQQERFTIVDGRLRLRVGGKRMVLGPGDSATIPRGTVHSFANAGTTPVRVNVETRPALAMEALLATAAELARAQLTARRRLPNLVSLALFMREYAHEVRAPYLPAPFAELITRSIAVVAGWFGLDLPYRRLRAGRDEPANA